MKYIARSAWGAKDARNWSPFAQRLGFAVHWTGGYMDLPNYAAAEIHVRQIQADHMAGRNSDKQPWADIAYNFVVWEDVAFEGRGWDHKNAANGDSVNNGKYLAVCVLIGPGNTFSAAAKDTIMQLVDMGEKFHGFGREVQPHSHFFQTQCPGDDIRNWITAGLTAAPSQPSQPPTIGPSQTYGDENMTRTPIHVPSLGDQGEGWVATGIPFEKVVNVLVTGPAPQRDGYAWPNIYQSVNNTDGQCEIELEGGTPHGSVDLIVWSV